MKAAPARLFSGPDPAATFSFYFTLTTRALLLGALALVFWKIAGAWLALVVFGGIGLWLLWQAVRQRFENDRLNLSLLWAASIGAIWPLLQNRMLITHDLDSSHLFFQNEFDRLIKLGAIYPRWGDIFSLGRGDAVFNYYPPAGRYLVEGLHFLGFSLADSFNALLTLTTLGSAQTMYLFARSTYAQNNRAGALLAGLAYLYFPYRICESYQRGALGEIVFCILTPLLLLVIYNLLVKGYSPGRFLAISGVAGVALLTHHLQVALTGLFGGIWVIFLLGGLRFLNGGDMSLVGFAELRRRIGWLLLGLVLGLAIGAIFWLPTVTEQNLVLVGYFNQKIIRDFAFSTQNLTLFPLITPESYNTNWIGLNQLVLALGCGLFFLRQRNKNLGMLLAFGFMVVILIILTIQLPVSYELFNTLNKLVPVQFPSRLMVFGGVASAWLVGLLPALLKGRWYWPGLALAATWIVVCGMVNVRVFYYPTNFDGTLSEQTMQSNTSRDITQYSPVELKPLLNELDILSLPPDTEANQIIAKALQSEAPGSADASRYEVTKGLNRFEINTTVSKATTLSLPPFYFPGWKVFISKNGSEQELTAFPTGKTARLGVNLPEAGDYHLIARFEDTPVRSAGTLISLGSLAIWLFLASFAGLPRRRTVS